MSNVNNTTLQNQNEWQEHTVFWGWYLVTHSFGFILCVALIWILLKTRRKTSADILISYLCLNCILFSVPWIILCTLRWQQGQKQGQRQGSNDENPTACWWESFAYLSAAIQQFYAIAFIAFRHYYTVILFHRKEISVRLSACVVVVWCVMCEFITYGCSAISTSVSTTSGEYCWFDWQSPVIVYWAVPSWVLTIIITMGCYGRIFVIANRTNQAIQSIFYVSGTPTHSLEIARYSFVFVWIYLVGWSPLFITCLYAGSNAMVPSALDRALGICCGIHSMAVPIAYAIRYPRVHRGLARFRCFQKCLGTVYKLKKGKSGVTVVTRGSLDYYENKPGHKSHHHHAEATSPVIPQLYISSIAFADPNRFPIPLPTVQSNSQDKLEKEKEQEEQRKNKKKHKKHNPSTLDRSIPISLPGVVTQDL